MMVEKTMLARLVYPCTSALIPPTPNLARKPGLHVLDTGLINHSLNLMGEMVFNDDISEAHRGIIAEHIVGQELLASKFSISNNLWFWTREKADASAEVDYTITILTFRTCFPKGSGKILSLRQTRKIY